PRSFNQKLKIMYLRDILYKYSDEEHPLSAEQICTMLRDHDVEAERKSIYSDMEMLATYGLDIMKLNGRDGGFFMGSREFELAELKLLIDAVMSSKFITKKKSEQLVKKLSSFACDYDADDLKRQLYSINRIKGQNESILYTVDDINSAIRLNRKISFKYCEWGIDIKLYPKKNGADYEVSPITLIWDDEYYYLVAYDSAAGIIKHYRVDKIKDIVITGSRRDKPSEKVDLSAYSGKMFGMFGGKSVKVCFECPDDKIGILIDRFGQEIKITSKKKGVVNVHTEAVLSSQFYGWVASVGPDIRIISPSEAVTGMKGFLKDNLSAY
ncbi:MAG: WYL domain-containing protein, partial [Lachnospiraceae bacterium]|nr:WYL domain-containing protein [Lachnospiraceae bacterium]